ncbi:hypothetical protein F4778DRAFT_775702 [Xylariomycetidae sp. FL2044]|nr:hypothetical protein F4778DRAFT_775702 [Xylariomycetidae sp. FL2044]
MPTHIANLFKEMTKTLPYHLSRATQGEVKTQGRIFADLLDSDLLESEKAIYCLSGEGFSLTSTGTEMMASGGILYLAQTATRERLLKEPQGVDPYPRLPRIARYESLMYEQKEVRADIKAQKPRYRFVIPMGTPIGMSSAITHHDETVWP